MLVKQGTTGKTVGIFVRKSDGTAYTGLAYNASGFKCYYVREGGSAVAVTLSGTNWTETDATNLPGRYKFIIPDAALVINANYVEFVFSGAADMLPIPLRIELVAFDPFTDFTTQVTGIKTKTDTFTFDIVTGKLETTAYTLGSFAVNAMTSAIWGAASESQVFPSSMGLLINNMAANATGIKAKTDQLSFTMANKIDSTVYGIYTTQAQQIANAVWESIPGDYGGAGAALAEIQSNINGILSTYDGQGYMQAIVMDITPNPRSAIAYDVWAKDISGMASGGIAAVDYVKAIKVKTDGLNFTGTDIKATLDGETVAVASLSAAALNAINVEVDTALNSVIPVTPTLGSINDKLNTLSFYEGKVRAYPEGGYVDSVSNYVPINPSVLASIWSYPTSSISAVGSIGLQLKTNLDTTITSRAATGALMGLADNAITAAKIATGAITNTKFAAGAIDSDALAASAADAITDAVWAEDMEPYGMGYPGTAGYNVYNIYGSLYDSIAEINSTTHGIHSKTDKLTFDANNWIQAYSNGGSIETIDGEVDLTPGSRQAIWEYSTAFVTNAGSFGKLLKDNLNATVSSRAVAGDQMNLENGAITAAKIGANAIESGAFAQGAITNFVLADDIIILSVGTITGNVNGNVLGSVNSVVQPVEATFSGDVTLAQAAIDAVAAEVWVADGRALTSAVDVSTDDIDAIRDGLATAGDLTFLATSSQVGQLFNILNPPVPHDQGIPTSFTYRMVNASGDPIEGVTIRVTRDREGTDEVMPDKVTNVLGETGWVLFSGTYYVTRTKDGQAYTNPDIWRIQG